MTPITDHIEQALAKLTARFRHKPRLAAWIASSVRQVQKLEDATWVQINNRDVDTCDEPRLRLLAKIVGQPFLGTTLDEFRLYVKVRILVNRSTGRVPELLRVARLLLGPSSAYEPGNAHIVITAETPVLGPVNPNHAAAFLREAKSGGVGLTLVYSASFEGDGTDFLWSYDIDSDDPLQGWAWNSENAPPGGFYAATA